MQAGIFRGRPGCSALDRGARMGLNAGVPVRFQFRPYRLALRVPVRTAHGPWSERTGVVVRLEDEAGRTGWGEAAPLPWFGTETVEDVVAAAGELAEWGDVPRFDAVPARLGCLRHALTMARTDLAGAVPPPAPVSGTLAVAALLPAGRAALAQVDARLEQGFRVFKWKVGVGEAADEWVVLDEICARLPAGARLRLDANGAWDRRRAEGWMARSAERPVEHVEQPCFAGAGATASERRRADDLLLGLAGDFPTPVALDESLVGEADLDRWLGAGWPGVYVFKPALCADPAAALARLARARAAVVFSSALETAIGAAAGLRLAFDWAGAFPRQAGGPPRALGYGVWPLFAEARCEGPFAVPFLRREDVSADPEAVWNALS